MKNRLGIPCELLLKYLVIIMKLDAGLSYAKDLICEQFITAFRGLEADRKRVHDEILKSVGKTRKDTAFCEALAQEVERLLVYMK